MQIRIIHIIITNIFYRSLPIAIVGGMYRLLIQSIITVPYIPNMRSTATNADKYWTSFWSPIGSIRELITKFSRHFEWIFPRLFGVFKKAHTQYILRAMEVVVKNKPLSKTIKKFINIFK